MTRGPVGPGVVLAGAPGTFRRVRSAATDTTALAQPSITTTAPTNGFALEGYPLVRVLFGGVGADNKDFAYQVVLWYVHGRSGESDSYVPVVAAKGVATLSGATYGTGGGSLGTSTNRLADTITETVGKAGVQVYPAAVVADTPAILEVQTRGAVLAEVQLDLDGGSAAATSMDVHCQLSTTPLVADGSLVGSRQQVTPKPPVATVVYVGAATSAAGWGTGVALPANTIRVVLISDQAFGYGIAASTPATTPGATGYLPSVPWPDIGSYGGLNLYVYKTGNVPTVQIYAQVAS